jgi:hypothetical protein
VISFNHRRTSYDAKHPDASGLTFNDLFDFVFKALPIRRLLFIKKVDDRLIEFCRLLQIGEMTASFDHG